MSLNFSFLPESFTFIQKYVLKITKIRAIVCELYKFDFTFWPPRSNVTSDAKVTLKKVAFLTKEQG